MGEALIVRRSGGSANLYTKPVLDANYPEDKEIAIIKGSTGTASFRQYEMTPHL